jgi:hypothetical protein
MMRQKISITVNRFMFFVLLGLNTLPVISAGNPCSESAQEYWAAFRTAVDQGDILTIANLSRFPFEVKGILDESDEREVLPEEFISLFPSLLEIDPGMAAAPTTMRHFVDENPYLSASFCNIHGNQFRVGAWVFELTSMGWRFSQAFLMN